MARAANDGRSSLRSRVQPAVLTGNMNARKKRTRRGPEPRLVGLPSARCYLGCIAKENPPPYSNDDGGVRPPFPHRRRCAPTLLGVPDEDENFFRAYFFLLRPRADFLPTDGTKFRSCLCGRGRKNSADRCRPFFARRAAAAAFSCYSSRFTPLGLHAQAGLCFAKIKNLFSCPPKSSLRMLAASIINKLVYEAPRRRHCTLLGGRHGGNRRIDVVDHRAEANAEVFDEVPVVGQASMLVLVSSSSKRGPATTVRGVGAPNGLDWINRIVAAADGGGRSRPHQGGSTSGPSSPPRRRGLRRSRPAKFFEAAVVLRADDRERFHRRRARAKSPNFWLSICATRPCSRSRRRTSASASSARFVQSSRLLMRRRTWVDLIKIAQRSASRFLGKPVPCCTSASLQSARRRHPLRPQRRRGAE